jgi:hypothetical protein
MEAPLNDVFELAVLGWLRDEVVHPRSQAPLALLPQAHGTQPDYPGLGILGELAIGDTIPELLRGLKPIHHWHHAVHKYQPIWNSRSEMTFLNAILTICRKVAPELE